MLDSPCPGCASVGQQIMRLSENELENSVFISTVDIYVSIVLDRVVLALGNTYYFNTLSCPFCSFVGDDWRVGRMRHMPVLQCLQLSSDILA